MHCSCPSIQPYSHPEGTHPLTSPGVPFPLYSLSPARVLHSLYPLPLSSHQPWCSIPSIFPLTSPGAPFPLYSLSPARVLHSLYIPSHQPGCSIGMGPVPLGRFQACSHNEGQLWHHWRQLWHHWRQLWHQAAIQQGHHHAIARA